MRRILIFCCFILSGIALTAQLYPENRIDSSGLKQGFWREYVVDYLFVNGNFTDTIYLENEDYMKQKCKIYECLGRYKDGKKTGIWTKYYYDDNIRMLVNYVNGVPTGLYKKYWINGNLQLECFIEENDSIVSVKTYNRMGKLIKITKSDKAKVIKSIYYEQ